MNASGPRAGLSGGLSGLGRSRGCDGGASILLGWSPRLRRSHPLELGRPALPGQRTPRKERSSPVPAGHPGFDGATHWNWAAQRCPASAPHVKNGVLPWIRPAGPAGRPGSCGNGGNGGDGGAGAERRRRRLGSGRRGRRGGRVLAATVATAGTAGPERNGGAGGLRTNGHRRVSPSHCRQAPPDTDRCPYQRGRRSPSCEPTGTVAYPPAIAARPHRTPTVVRISEAGVRRTHKSAPIADLGARP